jgi:hypothetical protein
MTERDLGLVRLATDVFVSVGWLLWLLEASSNDRNRRNRQ